MRQAEAIFALAFFVVSGSRGPFLDFKKRGCMMKKKSMFCV